KPPACFPTANITRWRESHGNRIKPTRACPQPAGRSDKLSWIAHGRMGQEMDSKLTRRGFAKQASWLLAGAQAGALLRIAKAADAPTAIVETSAGKVRGTTVDGI